MVKFRAHTDQNGKHVVDIECDAGENLYTTDPFDAPEIALEAARRWLQWFDHAPQGKAESIYYILIVPETWPGPPPGAHPYSGLHFKIGRSTDVRKRLQNLQTGTSGDLILHAMEPGSPERERELHEQFKSERRQGEWFSCSPALTKHVLDTWKRNNLLPPEYQAKLLELMDRIHAYRAMRDALGQAPDMVNPSINEPWHGRVFVDLVYTRLAKEEDS